jgi:hypothetical protein
LHDASLCTCCVNGTGKLCFESHIAGMGVKLEGMKELVSSDCVVAVAKAGRLRRGGGY